ncbi:hypothetical protein COSO111634_00360 [Corallococcus soli]
MLHQERQRQLPRRAAHRRRGVQRGDDLRGVHAFAQPRADARAQVHHVLQREHRRLRVRGHARRHRLQRLEDVADHRLVFAPVLVTGIQHRFAARRRGPRQRLRLQHAPIHPAQRLRRRAQEARPVRRAEQERGAAGVLLAQARQHVHHVEGLRPLRVHRPRQHHLVQLARADGLHRPVHQRLEVPPRRRHAQRHRGARRVAVNLREGRAHARQPRAHRVRPSLRLGREGRDVQRVVLAPHQHLRQRPAGEPMRAPGTIHLPRGAEAHAAEPGPGHAGGHGPQPPHALVPQRAQHRGELRRHLRLAHPGLAPPRGRLTGHRALPIQGGNAQASGPRERIHPRQRHHPGDPMRALSGTERRHQQFSWRLREPLPSIVF